MKKFTLKALIYVCGFLITGNINAQDVIDLTGFESATILADTLPDIPNGATVLLKPGMVYDAGGVALNQSVTIKSSEPQNLEMPKIDCAVNYNFTDGANIDSIVFMNIEFFGEYDARYVLNSSVSATVGSLQFLGCNIHDLRGIIRMKDSGPGSVDNFVIDNCEISMIRDYGILTVDRNDWMVNNIMISNSTISKTRAFITSRNNTNSLVIDKCNLVEVTQTGQRMFRWREAGQDNVAEGIMIKNTLWGHAWDEENTGSTAIDGFDGLGETTWTFENTTATSDLEFAEGKDTITGFNTIYPGTSDDLWVYVEGGDFSFFDRNFESIGFAGDQRWSVATADEGWEWNISDSAYSVLGEVSNTTTVAGLTIYAHSGKTVVIEENSKTVDEMEFTQRLKLGGSGDFDENGHPLGRVLSVEVEGNANITVAAMSSSSGSDRILNISAGSKDNVVAEFPALGASLTMGDYYYEGGPTKLYFYSPSSGVNVYYLKVGSVPTGAETVEIAKEDIAIYPNPASDRIFIEVNEPTNVGIYSITGKLIKHKMVYSKHDFIDVSDLSNGIYLIRSAGSDLLVKKFIKK
jgi:hypothetical protein